MVVDTGFYDYEKAGVTVLEVGHSSKPNEMGHGNKGDRLSQLTCFDAKERAVIADWWWT